MNGEASRNIDDLMEVAYAGDIYGMGLILDEGLARVNDTSLETGMTALHQACLGGELRAVAYLLDAGADIEAQNLAGQTPLHVACQFDNARLAELLLSRGADLMALDEDGRTPSHTACLNGRDSLLPLLSCAGVDFFSVKDDHGQTCFDLSLGADCADAAIYLMLERGMSLDDPVDGVSLEKHFDWLRGPALEKVEASIEAARRTQRAKSSLEAIASEMSAARPNLDTPKRSTGMGL